MEGTEKKRGEEENFLTSNNTKKSPGLSTNMEAEKKKEIEMQALNYSTCGPKRPFLS